MRHKKRYRELCSKLQDCRGALSHLAAKDKDAVRRYPRHQDDDGWQYDFMSPYEIDLDKFMCSKSIRREYGKAQVISLPLNDHVRNRLDHSREVVDLGVKPAQILGLNPRLVRAGGLPHDNGHGPYGHAFEDFILAMTGITFRHEVMGVITLQLIERRGKGLNLTKQTLRCILKHSRGAGALKSSNMTGEESLIMFPDKWAYTFSDYNDLFMRGELYSSGLNPKDYPEIVKEVEWFGGNQRERSFTCQAHLCIESAEKGVVSFRDSEAAKRFARLKKMMYEIYTSIDRTVINMMMESVFRQLEKCLRPNDINPVLAMALMNDRDVRWLFDCIRNRELFSEKTLKRLAVGDILTTLRSKEIDFTDPGLGW